MIMNYGQDHFLLKEKIKTYFENEKEFNNLLVKFRRRCLKKK